MIKKNTKVVFKSGVDERSEDMVGGIPLSKGEVMTIHQNGKIEQYEVTDKIIECFLDGEDQVVNITYIVSKKS